MKSNRTTIVLRLSVSLLLVATVLAFMLSFILTAFTTLAPAADELIFIRVTQQLPKYDSHVEWWSLGGKTHPNEILGLLPGNTTYDEAYEVPIRAHPPLANYLAYPAVKLLYSEDSVATIRAGVVRLRIIAWFMLALCILGTVWLVWRRNKSTKILLLSLLPLIACYVLFPKFGNNWFYHDIFMLMFFVIALLMRGTRYEKFIYIPLACMVACKSYALLFLIPFIIENRKTALCSLVLIPFMMQCYFVTGDFFYPFTFWNTVMPMSGPARSLWSIWRGALRVPFFLGVIALPFMYTTYNAIKKQGSWFLPLLFAIACITGLSRNAYYYRMMPMMVIGMLIAGEAVKHFIQKYRVKVEVTP